MPTVSTIRREIGDRKGESNSLVSIGSVYSNLGQYQEALKYHREALAIAREVGDQEGEARALRNIGWDYYNVGEKEKALDQYQKAIRIYEELRGTITIEELKTTYAETYTDKYAHPYYWAAFGLTGDPGRVSGYQPTTAETLMPFPSAEATTVFEEGTPFLAKENSDLFYLAGVLILVLAVIVAFIAARKRILP